jgi:alkanesulfonate monooxygenase SsuD/methylene tetrahydromethanopterin reductase-like flavin-dependent oxidoreductase (luciferase family)
MRFGLFTGALRTRGRSYTETYDEFIDYVCQAEQLGYDSTFLVEHHFTGLGDIGSSLSVLSNLAARTSTMRLGTAVTVLPWHVPTLLAEQAATLDVLSGGRLDFGVGRGYRPNEFHGFCIETTEAQARFEECLELVRLAWTSNERFSFDGAFWKLRDVIVEPKPVQPHPPIWVAAGSEGSVRRAADQGHRLLLDQFADPTKTAERVRWFTESCDQAGRAFDARTEIGLTRALLLLDTDDPKRRQDEIRRRARMIHELAESAKIPGGPTVDGRDHAFFDDSDDTSEAAAIVGGPEECIRRLEDVRAAGIDYVLLNDNWGGDGSGRLQAGTRGPSDRADHRREWPLSDDRSADEVRGGGRDVLTGRWEPMTAYLHAAWFGAAEHAAAYLSVARSTHGVSHAAAFRAAAHSEAMKTLATQLSRLADAQVGPARRYWVLANLSSLAVAVELAEMLGEPRGPRTHELAAHVLDQALMHKISDVPGPERGGGEFAPAQQLGVIAVKSVAAEWLLHSWYERRRLIEVATMPGMTRTRRYSVVAGQAKFGILYEFLSIEDRIAGFEARSESKGLDPSHPNAALVDYTIHMPGAPFIGERID